MEMTIHKQSIRSPNLPLVYLPKIKYHPNALQVHLEWMDKWQ